MSHEFESSTVEDPPLWDDDARKISRSSNVLPLVCSLAEIVEVEIEVVSPSIVPSGSFSELKSHCHLYGAQGQRQAYLLPMPR
ncbi:hypothetical protein TNCV_2093381 [Trichonephila clavipes]|nr:hypothetical protein TNCV_2093381 [Trichonephila clavipes]